MEEKVEFMKDVIYQNRKKKNLTQEQLAEQLNVSNKTISKWERGAGYPDIQIIPNLAKILDISIQSLFNVEDLKPTSIEKYNHSLLTIFKQRMILSFILFIFSPILYLISAFFLESKKLTLISIILGIIMIMFSILNAVMVSIKNYDSICNHYKNKKYILVFKNYLLIYILFIFIPLLFFTLIFESKFISISMIIFIYLLFLIFPWLIFKSLNLDIHKKENIIFLIISSLLFLISLFLMGCLSIVPYIFVSVLAQLINYIALFINK